MRGSVALCLFGLMAGTTHAEQWFMVQSPVSVSLDTASIQIPPSGQRRAQVKHDMSLVPPHPKEPPNHPLYFIMMRSLIAKAKHPESRQAKLTWPMAPSRNGSGPIHRRFGSRPTTMSRWRSSVPGPDPNGQGAAPGRAGRRPSGLAHEHLGTR